MKLKSIILKGIGIMLILLSVKTVFSASSNLQFSIIIPKQNYIIGEPVIVLTCFKNTGTSEIRVVPKLGSEWDPYFIYYKTENSKKVFCPGMSLTYLPRIPDEGISLNSGETCIETVLINVGLIKEENSSRSKLDYVFSTAGSYTLQVIYNNNYKYTNSNVWTGSLTSNVVSFTVSAPTGIDKTVFDRFLTTSEVKKLFAYYPIEFNWDAKQVFERLLKSYPGSSYAGNIHYYLAKCYMKGQAFEQALSAYQEFLNKHPNSVYKWDALFGIGECQLKIGRKSGARSTLQEVVDNAPKSRTLEDAKRLLGGI
jgi:tetratricopeptide (TPR) repeat protein